MADFKNEFSWSKSRNDLFQDCARKYYFNYYGSWNGWKYNSDTRTREIYYLKKLQSRYMWIGSVVHVTIENLLKLHRSGAPIPETKDLEARLLADLRSDFSTSRAGEWAKKKWRLFEHEYDSDVADEEWREIAAQAQLCFANFLKSNIYEKIKKLEPHQWLEVEEFSSFYVDGVKIHVVLDFSFRDGDDVYIYDWKTGKSEGSLHELQLACYRIYAEQKWNPAGKIHTLEFNLARDAEKEYSPEGFSKEDALEKIRSSIAGMKDLLSNVEKNEAVEDDFAFTEEQNKCSFCQFQRVCPSQS